MIVRSLEDIDGTEGDVKAPTFFTKRFLLRKDKMGFSLHDTTLFAGTNTYIWYKHHLEAVYCIEGEADIEVQPDGPTYHISPGIMYALNGHEKHYLRVGPDKDFRAICVFNPALTGQEVHDEEGVYPLIEGDE